MNRVATSPNRSRLLLPVLGILLLTTMALVSYVALASDEVEQACVEQQIHTRAAVATILSRLKPVTVVPPSAPMT